MHTSRESTSRTGMDDLLLQTGRGSSTAFAALYDRLAPTVYGIAIARHPDPVEAEKAAERAFLAIWHASPSYRARSADAAEWLLVTARRALALPSTEGRGPDAAPDVETGAASGRAASPRPA